MNDSGRSAGVAPSADILIRDQRSGEEIPHKRPSFARGADEEVRAPLSRKKRFSHGNCGARRRARKTNQLIVGPPRWAYQVLGATLGERFIENLEARISIDRYFIAVIAVWVIAGLVFGCEHFFGRA